MLDINANIDFNDRDNPVPGTAAWIAKQRREAQREKFIYESKKEIDKASEDFPAFARIMKLMESTENE